jgi:glutamyl-tRNA reductase
MKTLIPASLRFFVVGLNHKTAPLALRESVTFDGDHAEAAIGAFKRQFPAAECVLLSTCNRVEFYISRPLNAAPDWRHVAAFLATTRNVPEADLAPHLYHREDRAAAEHLFAVASSLDSMVVGETQILAQVKAAYAAACAAGTADTILHSLFQRSIAAAKNVHEGTALSSGRVSIASVAIDLAQQVFDRFDDKNVLCIGAGKMADLMLKNLRRLQPRKITITNRSHERAITLAATHAATSAPFESLPQSLIDADIVLTSTGASEPIMTAPQFKKLLKARRHRPLLLIDIAVPRDVDPAVGELNNVYLYNVDDLQEVSAGNRQRRDAEVAKSRAILAEHVEEFMRWYAARDVGPIVQALYQQAHAHAQSELDQLLAKHPEWPEAQRDEMRRMAHRLVGKLLHGPVKQLTEKTEATARPTLAAATKTLFNLEGANSQGEADGGR